MEKLIEVEEAKAIMIEAVDWSVMKWLREKKMVRKMADRANAALDSTNAALKAKWSSGLRNAYESLNSSGTKSANIDPDLLALAKRVKHADDAARKARDDAEKTFDDAEKRLSTTMAREGSRKAIISWELHEKALKLAEEGLSSTKQKT